jgi:hypothetical protein
MKTNIRIVAVPFTTADRVLEVTRSAGFKYRRTVTRIRP